MANRVWRAGVKIGLLAALSAAVASAIASVKATREERHRRYLEERRDLWPPVPTKQASEARIDGALAADAAENAAENP